MRTLIKGGTIVNADATARADVLVDGETIALIGTDLGQNFAVGNTDPYFHGTSRSPVLEGEATNRVIRLAQVAERRSTSSILRPARR